MERGNRMGTAQTHGINIWVDEAEGVRNIDVDVADLLVRMGFGRPL